jgi:hypothetical protein
MKTTQTQQRIGRVGQWRQVVIPREILETLPTLTPAEAKIVRRGLAQLKREESRPWRLVKDALSL